MTEVTGHDSEGIRPRKVRRQQFSVLFLLAVIDCANEDGYNFYVQSNDWNPNGTGVNSRTSLGSRSAYPSKALRT